MKLSSLLNFNDQSPLEKLLLIASGEKSPLEIKKLLEKYQTEKGDVKRYKKVRESFSRNQ